MRSLILTLLIWTICFVTITFGIGLVYDWYKHIGVDIKISFNDAEGLVPNQSKVIYKGAQIGTVKSIVIDPKDKNILVTVRMTKPAAQLAGAGTKFWIVRPELGIGEINNLSAISTGDYIEMNPVDGEPQTSFIGLEDEPVEESTNGGLKLLLRADSVSGLSVGTDILYRGMKVGEIGDIDLARDNRTINLTVYIDKKYSAVIRKNSYFTNISGFHASIHLFGTSFISMDSLSTLVKGGISVVTPDLRSPLAKEGDVFNLRDIPTDS